MIGCEDFLKHYRPDGMLRPLYEQIECPESTMRNRFVSQLLVLNMALSIHKVIDDDYPDLQVQIASIEGDLIHLQLANVDKDFDIASFSEQLDEMTRDLSLAYFSIGKATLEDVHSKLISRLYDQVDDVDITEEHKTGDNFFLARKRTVFANSRGTNVLASPSRKSEIN